jgi:hypothetical protein
MIFDLATDTQMHAARIFGGASMAALVAAPMFRRQAQRVRMVAAGIYIIGVLCLAAYALI